MKILITGGNGYVGSKLVENLKEKGHEVSVYDLPDNILDVEKLNNEVAKNDIVYHLAALAELKYTDEHPEETYDVNITGLRNVIDACVKSDVLLNFISTCCIYGNALELPSQEDRMINPSDTYAMSKAAGEYVVKMFHLARGLRYNILRLGTVYGLSSNPEMRADMCIQIFLNKVLKGEKLPIDGNGKQYRNFIHIDDLAEGLSQVTENKVENETLNFAGLEAISVIDIAEACLDAAGMDRNNIYFRPKRKDDFRYQMVSMEKTLRMLKWLPTRIFSVEIKTNYELLKG